MTRRNYFDLPVSRLIELFMQRSGFPVVTPEGAIRALASRLSTDGDSCCDLDRLLPTRQIDQEVVIAEDLPCDGIIDPKGRTYIDGFRMHLRGGQSDRRLRFTKAHEICH